MKPWKIIRGIGIGFLIVILVLGLYILWFFFHQRSTPTTYLMMREVRLVKEQDTAVLRGNITMNAKSYRSYSYSVEGDALYVTVYNGLVNFIDKYNVFDIEIKDAKLKNVQSIYLRHGKTTEKIFQEP